MIYVTTRIALEAFEYDPYGEKPEWFVKMVKEGKAFEYSETKKRKAYAELNGRIANIGDRICLDETGYISVYTAERFARCAKPIDKTKEAASMFIERIKDAAHNMMD